MKERSIRLNKFSFKVTDLLGVLFLIHPIWSLVFKHPIGLLFYVELLFAFTLLYQNFFGMTGYYVRLTKNSVIFYDRFFPESISIKNIVDIDKETSHIAIKTNNNKAYFVDFNKIPKAERYKTNDFFYDIHNKVYRKTLEE